MERWQSKLIVLELLSPPPTELPLNLRLRRVSRIHNEWDHKCLVGCLWPCALHPLISLRSLQELRLAELVVDYARVEVDRAVVGRHVKVLGGAGFCLNLLHFLIDHHTFKVVQSSRILIILTDRVLPVQLVDEIHILDGLPCLSCGFIVPYAHQSEILFEYLRDNRGLSLMNMVKFLLELMVEKLAFVILK